MSGIDKSSIHDRIADFRQAMQTMGLRFDKIVDDGKFHRGNSSTKKRHNTNAWYMLFPDAVGGAFGDWATGEQATWHFEGYTNLSQQDRAEHDAKIQERYRQQGLEQEEAAYYARDLFNSGSKHGESAYLKRKHIPPLAIRFDDKGTILVPMYDASGALWSVQRIFPDGGKRFIKGGKKQGCYCAIGEPIPGRPLIVCEGYSTGVSLHLATNVPVIVAFDAGNLGVVMGELVKQHDPSFMVIAGDDDKWHAADPTKNTPNAGREKAIAAGDAYGCKVVFPVFPADADGQPTDFNDLHIACGLKAVQEQVGMTLQPALKVRKAQGEPSLNELNNTYAMVITAGKCSILREATDADGRYHIDLMGVDGFKAWEGANSANAWLNWEGRRKYNGIVFDPVCKNPRFYNLWRGFSITPQAGDWHLFAEHLLENLCHGDEGHYFWVLAWFAQMLQQPEKKTGTALAIRGQQGTGKTIIGKIFGRLLGSHYMLVSNPKLITGSFNSHLANCLLLHSDEGFWAGDKNAEGVLKSLITSDTIPIERKGFEPVVMKSMTRLLICSNNDWVVPAAMEERRFCVMDIGSAKMQNNGYFAAMLDQMDNGGYAALLHDLLNFDLSTVNIWDLPVTDAGIDQKQMSMETHWHWWFEKLQDGALFAKDSEIDPWPPSVEIHTLYEDYLGFCEIHYERYALQRQQLGKELAKLFPGGTNVCSKRAGLAGKRARHYILPSLQECRAHWDGLLGKAMDWQPYECEEAA